MRMQILIVILVSAAVISSCRKGNNPPENIISEFPNEVGNHWHYLYTTTQSNTIDVDIVGTRILPGGQTAKVWAYKYNFSIYPMRTDTSYVVVDSQLVKIYKLYYGSYYERMRYKLPVTVGDMWTLSPPDSYKDTTWVLGKYPVTVPAGTFETYELKKERGYIVNSWTNNKIWFSPKVGVIKFEQSEYSLGPVLGNGLWELIDYTVH